MFSQKGAHNMKKQITIFLSCLLIIYLLFPIAASADTGPKPSIVVQFKNMGDELCYGTLLSKEKNTGPYSAWDGSEEDMPDAVYTDLDIWRAFVDYEDADGYYFLQKIFPCSEDKEIDWGYLPPSPFKILLYYPKTNTFISSGIYEKYAFDSYFSIDMNGIDIATVTPVLIAEESYSYARELFSLFCRIVVTILLEVCVAFLFGFGRKNLLIWIFSVNIATQILLNLTLNFTFHEKGSLSFTASYLLLECLVFVIESALYLVLFSKFSNLVIPQWKIILYAFTANVVSFGGGMLIATLIPVIS